MPYKIPFNLPRELIDGAISMYDRDHVKRVLQEALIEALNRMQPAAVREANGIRRMVIDGEMYVVWSDVVRLLRLSNPAYYFQKERRRVTVPWRNSPIAVVPFRRCAFNFLLKHNQREIAFLIAKDLPPVDELDETVSADDRSNPT